MKIFEYIWGTICALFLIIGLGYALTNGSSSKSSSYNSTYHSSKPYNRYRKHQNQQVKEFQDSIQRLMDDFAKKYNQTSVQQIPVVRPPIYRTHAGTPRDNYRELWEECEVIIDALDEAGVDHDYLSYPMDYYELRDLRDELEYTAEENDVEW